MGLERQEIMLCALTPGDDSISVPKSIFVKYFHLRLAILCLQIGCPFINKRTAVVAWRGIYCVENSILCGILNYSVGRCNRPAESREIFARRDWLIFHMIGS